MNTAPLKILIVEDEYITQKTLSIYLNELGYKVIATAMNYNEAIDKLNTNTIELAILDISLQDNLNGIDLANYIIKKYNIPHIFLTAYSDENTIKNALNTKPLGYLIKPFSKTDLFTSIEIAISNYNFQNKINDTKNYIYLKHNEIYKKILIKDVIYIESQKNYLTIVTNNCSYKYRSTLIEIKKILSNNFIQVHKGFLVDKQKIEAVSGNYIIANQHKIPVSKTYKTILDSLIN